jgi:23S rRNA (adenine2503-C2)-methyltransferase
VIFEYALNEMNSAPEHAAELAGRLRGMQCHVNVIPLNTVAENAIQGVNEAVVTRFIQELEKRHISVTRRREMGDDIDGACGQLRRHYLEEQ